MELSIIIHQILINEYLIHSLGLTTAMAMFISPVFYNGDFKKPIRAVTVLLGCLFFSILLFYGNDMNKKWRLDYKFSITRINQFLLYSRTIHWNYYI